MNNLCNCPAHLLFTRYSFKKMNRLHKMQDISKKIAEGAPCLPGHGMICTVKTYET